MAQSWRTVRVFISRTLRDRHADPDQLVRIVLLELKECCRKRHIQLLLLTCAGDLLRKLSSTGR